MTETEAFREFKAGLNLLRDNYAMKALPHMKRAVDLDKNNPYYMSYLGVVLARSEQKWGEAERLCDTAVRLTIAMNRLVERRPPVLTFLTRQNALNRQLGMLRHKTLQVFGQE